MPAELTGRWKVERRVRDLRTGTTGRFAGTATFHADGRWIEQGTLEFGGYRGPARRELRIVDGIVHFSDGRRFHELDLGGRAVEHLCGADRYAGRYRLDGHDRLEIVWRVSGPAKDQLIESVYRRA